MDIEYDPVSFLFFLNEKKYKNYKSTGTYLNFCILSLSTVMKLQYVKRILKQILVCFYYSLNKRKKNFNGERVHSSVCAQVYFF